MNNNNNITNIILKNKKKILSQKNNISCITDQQKKNISYIPISSNLSLKKYTLKLKEAYTIMKEDKNIILLEEKFNMIWKKEDIILI
ncbi:hypothetical protein [Buchnera aphidicola]|uniref:hypothetical protein n=1 Tax=Buchnera aphidicola TaxID=9 RepID=UPI00346388C6